MIDGFNTICPHITSCTVGGTVMALAPSDTWQTEILYAIGTEMSGCRMRVSRDVLIKTLVYCKRC